MKNILPLIPVLLVGIMFLLLKYQEKKVKEDFNKNPDNWVIINKKIKKKASNYSIASIILLFTAALSFLTSIWLFLSFLIIFFIILCVAVYYFISEKESEITEYNPKENKDGIIY